MLFLCTISLIGYFLLKNSSREIIYSSEKKLIHSSELIKLEFSKFIENLRYDITHISNSPFIHYYLENPKEENRDLLSTEYLSLLRSKPYYSQIRFISKRQNGQEIVRVERNNTGDTKILPISESQNKGSTSYYLETIKLPLDSLYISDIDLNKEYNKISRPYIPTLRIACPVYHKEKLEGIIVINTDLTELFNSLDRITDNVTKMLIVNKDGFYLYHENNSETFGFEFGKSSTFKSEFKNSPNELLSKKSSIFSVDDKLYCIDNLCMRNERDCTYILTYANKKTLLKSYYSWRNTSFIIIFLLGLISFGIAFFYMKKQSKALKDIADKIKSFPTSLNPIQLVSNRKDEIGDLVTSFNKMSSIIFNNISLLTESNKTAENAIIEKEEFIENMSHEIRNPLQSIIGLSHLMESEDLSDHQRKILEGLRFNTQNLQILVNEILDFKNIQRNGKEVELSWINIQLFVDQILTSNNEAVARKKIKFISQVDDALIGYSMQSDLTKLTQIVANLISNAIKFTKDGGEIKLKIEKLDSALENNTIRITLTDNGIGIDENIVHQITNRYFTKNDPLSFTKGFGLGLSIIVKLLSILNSKLNIESKEGHGSKFWFDLDTHLEKSIDKEDLKIDQFSSRVLKDFEILVVEDDEQIIKIYDYIFNEKVKNITYITNIEEITSDVLLPYNIVILDFYMNSTAIPDYYPNIKFIENSNPLFYIVSGKKIAKDKLPQQLKQSTIILKPFEPKEILETITYAFLEKKYGIPQLDPIKADYDFNKKIYNNAINLLITEWIKIESELKLAILNEDIVSIASIRHKIITTARRLKLTKFEGMLESIEKDIILNGHLATSSNISLAMQFYIKAIKTNIVLP